jgi:sugar phosphate isomerase/epimerase
MRRRDFVQSLGATLGVPFVGGRLLTLGASARLNRIGLELYAVRDAMRRDPERTLAAIRAFGYLDVELLWSFNNFDRTPKQVRATLDKEGLRAPSAHMAPEVILKDWDKSLETAKLIGHDYLIVPSLPGDTAKSLDRWKYWADQFNIAGAAARKADVWLAFHSEPDHVKPINGVVPYDVFVDRTDPSVVRHQLDIGNMALGGADPMKYLEKYRDRYWSFHVKDVVAGGAKDTELGKGVVDIKGLLARIPDIDRKPVYVEQEGPADSMESARLNYQYLSRLDF